MAKGDKFYFENFAASAALSLEAANYLVSCLETYDPEKLERMMEQMHAIEHRADTKKHEMNAALAKAFVTPVDREDLNMLSGQMDEVTDMIEEVLQKFYINNTKAVRPAAVEFAKNIVESCRILCDLMVEFEHFKKSKKIRELVIALNDVEEECDKLYLSSMHALAAEAGDAFELIAWRDIFDCLEACADACEHVSDCVEAVVMKNT